MICKGCNEDVEMLKKPVNNIHRVEYRCPICNAFNNYPKKEDSSNNNRENNHKELVRKSGINFCQNCLCPEQLLPKQQTLEAHHVIEYSDGGPSEPNNIWILCTRCHKQVHHIRTYTKHWIDIIKQFKEHEQK